MSEKTVIWDFTGTLSRPESDIFNIAVEEKGLDLEEKLEYRDELDEEFSRKYENPPLGTIVMMMSEEREEFKEGRDPDLSGTTREELKRYGQKIKMKKGHDKALSEILKNGFTQYLVSADPEQVIRISPLDLSHFKEICTSELRYNEEGEIVGYKKDDDGCRKTLGPHRKVKEFKELIGGPNLDMEDVYYIGEGFTDKEIVGYIDENGGTSICIGDNSETMKNSTWGFNGNLKYKGRDLKDVLGDSVNFKDERLEKDIERHDLSEEEVVYEKIKGVLGAYKSEN